MLDVKKLLIDIFDPEPDEVATVMVDVPGPECEDNPGWRARREMAGRWREVLQVLGAERGFTVNPILAFSATGGHNRDLPAVGTLGETEVDLDETLHGSTLLIAMTEYSATAPLVKAVRANELLRAASMPMVEARMEETALAADYQQVARRCRSILEVMRGAVLCDVCFSTGHRCWFDLRHRQPEADDGYLHRDKQGIKAINLPSGETFSVPYEGEIEGVPSQTAGTIPVVEDQETVLFHIADNRIRLVEGDGPAAERWAEFFTDDPARANLAEVAFGVNDRARVTGNVLEDEKAGFHWAFGRSDHLGGVVGVDAFRSPETVVHQDIVYARGNPVQVVSATIIHPDGRRIAVIEEGEYVV